MFVLLRNFQVIRYKDGLLAILIKISVNNLLKLKCRFKLVDQLLVDYQPHLF